MVFSSSLENFFFQFEIYFRFGLFLFFSWCWRCFSIQNLVGKNNLQFENFSSVSFFSSVRNFSLTWEYFSIHSIFNGKNDRSFIVKSYRNSQVYLNEVFLWRLTLIKQTNCSHIETRFIYIHKVQVASMGLLNLHSCQTKLFQ